METAVKIEKEIENLCSLEEFSNFLNVVYFSSCGKLWEK